MGRKEVCRSLWAPGLRLGCPLVRYLLHKAKSSEEPLFGLMFFCRHLEVPPSFEQGIFILHWDPKIMKLVLEGVWLFRDPSSIVSCLLFYGAFSLVPRNWQVPENSKLTFTCLIRAASVSLSLYVSIVSFVLIIFFFLSGNWCF